MSTMLAVRFALLCSATSDVLRGLTRAERRRLTKEIIKLNHPRVPSKVMKTLISAGKYPKRYSQGQMSEALALKVKEAIGARLSFVGSASSGSVRSIAVGLHEAMIN